MGRRASGPLYRAAVTPALSNDTQRNWLGTATDGPMLTARMIALAQSRPGLKERLRKVASVAGYDVTDWVRVVMYE